MTQTQAFLESQLLCLRTSLLTLSTESKDLAVSPQVSEQLGKLCSRISTPSSCRPHPAGLGEALEIIRQARSSLDLLTAMGYLTQGEGDDLSSQLRSALNDLEMATGKELRKRPTAGVFGLYVIIDPEITGGRDPQEVGRAALKGGARVLQLRDKLREKGQMLPLAKEMKQLCAEYGALFMVNDHADLASVLGSDGLHIGQGDLPVAEARRILKPQQVIGRSNHLLEEVLESENQGADHVAIGSVYPSSTKSSISCRPPTGPQAVRRAKQAVSVPVVAIGGINEENVEPVVMAGADAICVTSAVGLAPNPEDASRRLVERILRAGGRA